MGKMFQMTFFSFMAGALGALGQESQGVPYCSLIVRVVDQSGQEVESAVTVAEKDGRTISMEMAIGGARFCDLGILPVTVAVGREGACNYTVVNNVPLDWSHTYTLVITQDREACTVTLPPAPEPYCQLLLRVATSGPESSSPWLSGAVVRPVLPGGRSVTTDAHGRAYLALGAGRVLSVVIEHSDHQSRKEAVRCERDTPRIERKVRMTRR